MLTPLRRHPHEGGTAFWIFHNQSIALVQSDRFDVPIVIVQMSSSRIHSLEATHRLVLGTPTSGVISVRPIELEHDVSVVVHHSITALVATRLAFGTLMSIGLPGSASQFLHSL